MPIIENQQNSIITTKQKPYYYRKVQWVRQSNSNSLNLTVPKQYALALGLGNDEFVKVSVSQDRQQIVIEKEAAGK